MQKNYVLACYSEVHNKNKIRRKVEICLSRDFLLIKTSQREPVMTSLGHALHRDVFSNEFFPIHTILHYILLLKFLKKTTLEQ
jgi:hypothetical protein